MDEANRIKQARTEAGLTQKEMSEVLGIPKRTIEDWETNRSKPAPWAEALIIEKLKTMKPKG
jgi:DNA-binding transcriptional regulator YiaG